MLRRFMTGMDFSRLNAVRPEKTLTQILPKKSRPDMMAADKKDITEQ